MTLARRRFPLQRAFCHSPTNRLVVSFSNRFIVLDAASGCILAAPEDIIPHGEDGVKSIPLNQLPLGEIRSVAFKGDMMALASDSKSLQFWNIRTLSQVSTRETIKRPNVILYSTQEDSIVVGDKFGDVYSLSISNIAEKDKLLLGHVSVITDMILSKDGSRIITADRDEKLRVSKFPHTYIIDGFCLGHTEFISKICLCPFSDEQVLSVGGDSQLMSWNFTTMECVQKLDILEALGDGDCLVPTPITVASIKSSSYSNTVAVIVENSPCVLIYGVNKSAHLRFSQRIRLPSSAFDIEFDAKGNLWVILAQTESGPRISYCRYINSGPVNAPQYELPLLKEPLLSQIDRLNIELEIETLPDFGAYLRQLRKINEDEMQERRQKRFKKTE